MSAGKLDILIEQGATFSHILLWRDVTDTPIDITNYTARMQIRAKVTSATVLLDVTPGLVIDGALGKVTITIADTVTDAITWLRGKYDLEIESAAGVVTRLIEGDVKVSFNTTR